MSLDWVDVAVLVLTFLTGAIVGVIVQICYPGLSGPPRHDEGDVNYARWRKLAEGTVRKGGVNPRPITPAPPAPKPQERYGRTVTYCGPTFPVATVTCKRCGSMYYADVGVVNAEDCYRCKGKDLKDVTPCKCGLAVCLCRVELKVLP